MKEDTIWCMKRRKRYRMKLDWRNCGKILVIVALVYLLFCYGSALLGVLELVAKGVWPLILGAGIAYIVNILMNFYERYYEIICRNAAICRLKRPMCLLLSFLSVFLVLVVLCQIIVPQLIACANVMLKQCPEVIDVAYKWLEDRYQISAYLSEQVVEWTKNPLSLDGLLENAFSPALAGLGEAMSSIRGILASFGEVAFNVVVAIVFAVYLLARKERTLADVRKLSVRFVPERIRGKLVHIFGILDECFHRFIVGQCVEAVILGILCIVGMWIFRFPYAVMVGCLIGFTALIPVAGAYIGAAAGAFMIFTVSPVKAAFFLVFIFVLQQLEGNLIYPRVVGKSMGLPGIWVLAAVVVGGAAFGIPGILLGVPLTAAGYQLLQEAVEGCE